MIYQNENTDLKEYYKKRHSVINCMLVAIVVMGLTLVHFYNNWDNYGILREQSFNTSLVVTLMALYITGIVSWIKMKNRMVSIYMIFFIYMFFSNLGQSMTHIFIDNKFTLFSVYGSNSLQIINQALLFQMICVAGLNLGATVGTYFYTKKYGIKDIYMPSDSVAGEYKLSKFDLIFDILFYIGTAYTIAYALYQLALRQTISYEELYETREGASSYLRYFCRVIGVYYVCKSAIRKEKTKENFFYAAWSLLIVLNMAAGTRSAAIVYIGSLIFILRMFHPELFKRKYTPIYILIILGFCVAMSVISVTRQMAMGESDVGEILGRGLLYNLQLSMFEFGLSEYPAIIALKAIEKGVEHQQTIIYYTLQGFCPSRILNIFGLYKPSVGDTGLWATDYSNFTNGETGFSCVAEAYLNYGKAGWIFMVIYGSLVSYWELLCIRKIKEGKLLFPSVFVYLLSRQIFFARGQYNLISTAIRLSVYVLMGYIVLRMFKERREIKRRI